MTPKQRKAKNEYERERRRLHRLHRFEYAARARGFTLVGGIDEVGRGPLAGPVVAACVVADRAALDQRPQRLEAGPPRSCACELAEIDQAACDRVGVGSACVAEIDRLNIYWASILAMERAIAALAAAPEYLITDAVRIRSFVGPQEPLIHGDARCALVAAASILAKVHRDALMVELDKEDPRYGFALHKGYSTPHHLEALRDARPERPSSRELGARARRAARARPRYARTRSRRPLRITARRAVLARTAQARFSRRAVIAWSRATCAFPAAKSTRSAWMGRRSSSSKSNAVILGRSARPCARSTLASARRFAASPPTMRRSWRRPQGCGSTSSRSTAAAEPSPKRLLDRGRSSKRSKAGAAPERHAVGLVLMGLLRRRRRHLRRPRARSRVGGRRVERRLPIRRHRLRLHRPRVHGARRNLSGGGRRTVFRHARPRRYFRLHRRMGGPARLHDRRNALCLELRRLHESALARAR